MLGSQPIFCICYQNPQNPQRSASPFSQMPKNKSRQNQKQNIPSERSYQKMKKTHKNTYVKNLHPQELFTLKKITDQGIRQELI